MGHPIRPDGTHVRPQDLSDHPREYVWLIVTDEDRIFGIRNDETKARRTAKAIDGYMIRLEIYEDHRKE